MRTGVRVITSVRVESGSTVERSTCAGEALFSFAGGAVDLTFTEEALKRFVDQANGALAALDAARTRA